ncbi:hypothetical protein AAEO56_02310 [Flavobacterium sp. DGU11]|uniref:Uncharacterized protein n=1 Tax=Flavobacterium arundinis TaxID=3139143 RepID=A0ABU9HSE2_9FLAO
MPKIKGTFIVVKSRTRCIALQKNIAIAKIRGTVKATFGLLDVRHSNDIPASMKQAAESVAIGSLPDAGGAKMSFEIPHA